MTNQSMIQLHEFLARKGYILKDNILYQYVEDAPNQWTIDFILKNYNINLSDYKIVKTNELNFNYKLNELQKTLNYLNKDEIEKIENNFINLKFDIGNETIYINNKPIKILKDNNDYVMKPIKRGIKAHNGINGLIEFILSAHVGSLFNHYVYKALSFYLK